MSQGPDTRPSELAEIVKDEQKFRWYVVTKLERNDAKMDAHLIDDKRNFMDLQEAITELQTKAITVSSAVGGIDKERSVSEGTRKTLLILCAFVAWLIPTALSLMAVLK